MTTLPTDSFVPLTASQPAASDHPGFRVLALHPSEGGGPCRPQPHQSATSQPAPGATPACEPRVSLQREGDRVTGIHIQCSCGQSIELACMYQP